MSRQDADDEDTRPATDSTDDTTEQAPQEADEAADEQSTETPDTAVETALDEIAVTDPDLAVDLSVDVAETGPDQDLASAVEQLADDALADVIATLRAQRDALGDALADERERADDFESRLKRKQADFQNYKKRQNERMKEEKQRATEDLVTRLLDVRDNLARALEQDESADIRGGIESTLDEFDRELDKENVSVIDPMPGDDVDPQRHEVLIRIESSQPQGTVAEVHRSGYEMAGKVLRPAQIAVSDGTGPDDAESGSDEDDDSQ